MLLGKRGRSVEVRLRERLEVEIVPNGCWVFPVAGPGGYGYIRDNDQQKRAVHRVAYELWVGSIPDGLEIDHICRRRTCCNPAHMQAVTKSINTSRKPRKVRCIRGHEYTLENTYIKKDGRRECRTCRKQSMERFTRRWAVS